MRAITSIALACVLWVFGALAPVSAGDRTRAQGEFTVDIDLSTLTLTPVDENCLLVVEGIVVFTGTLEGLAPARTRALVLASCQEIEGKAPNEFNDVFTSKLEFAGTVDGVPTVADITYRGTTQFGGDIDALMIASNGLRGVLKVDATVAVGGSYGGFLR